VWTHFNYTEVAGDDVGFIRFVLGTLLASVLLVRWKNPHYVRPVAGWLTPTCAGVGTGMALVGIILDLKQFEWLGLVLLLAGCLLWSLPGSHARDVLSALFVLYWIHPIHAGAVAALEGNMQRLSVGGSEWLLHCFNHRVWADGTDLITGTLVFSVPPECSGLLTAMTVMVCTLGVGMLLRLRWFEIPVFLVLGLLQVLVLNILRISLMVWFAPSQGSVWARNFLHDSLGFFLLLAIVLVQVEASWWRIRRRNKEREAAGREAGDVEEPDKATIFPRFWHLSAKVYKPVVLVVVLLAGTVYAHYKHRPSHRASMIGGIVENLSLIDPARAHRAIDVALGLAPDREMFQVQKFRVLMLRERFSDALKQFNEHLGEDATVADKVLKSWALVGLKREDEALALVESLPEGYKRSPQVAIVRAQYAVRKDLPRMVAKNVVIASRSHRTVRRVRALYPYLAMREQWAAIVASENERVAYEDPVPALVSAQAHIRMNRLAGAGQVLRQATETWPDDIRFLSSLIILAAQRPDTHWEALFDKAFRRVLPKLDVDRLSNYLDECFRMTRPDLAWLAYAALQEKAPGDPALLLAPAQHGGMWFAFRKRKIGMRAQHGDEVIDLASFCSGTRQLWPLRDLWDHVPLVRELGGRDVNRVRTLYVKRCLLELMKREQRAPLELRLARMVPVALAMQGRYKEAHKRLAAIAAAYPKEKRKTFLQQAKLYAQQGEWQHCYERLREYSLEDRFGDLGADMMTISALMNMGLGVAAMDAVDRADERFPDSKAVIAVRAAIWQVFGHAGEALFCLGAEGGNVGSADVVELLDRLGRRREALKLARSLGLRLKKQSRQSLMLLPAEDVLKAKWPPALTSEEKRSVVTRLEAEQHQAASPFLEKLRGLEKEWLQTAGAESIRDPARWRGIGRDARERAASLHRLALLAGHAGKAEQALAAVRLALKDMPGSGILWRMAMALSRGDAETVAEARRRCPQDSHVWLASLVVKLRDVSVTKPASAEQAAWAAREITDHRGKVSVDAMVRAGDLLFRKGLKDAAADAARYAMGRAPGYVPAVFLGTRCALALKDAQWTLKCALRGAEYAQDPAPFLKLIVMIKSTGNRLDADMFAALENLVKQVPRETYWSERLASAYFHKGNARRALTLLAPLINADARGMHVHSLLLAAEAARRAGRVPEAVAILEKAYLLYPDNVSVLNNLVYTLAQGRRTLGRANRLLPELRKRAARSPALLDTVAWVHLRSGRMGEARKEMERAVELLDMDPKTYAAPEMMLNAAEILMRAGQHTMARHRIKAAQNHPGCTTMDHRRAAELLSRIPSDSD
jgi:exosortase/archaeosortase family protein